MRNFLFMACIKTPKNKNCIWKSAANCIRFWNKNAWGGGRWMSVRLTGYHKKTLKNIDGTAERVTQITVNCWKLNTHGIMAFWTCTSSSSHLWTLSWNTHRICVQLFLMITREGEGEKRQEKWKKKLFSCVLRSSRSLSNSNYF